MVADVCKHLDRLRLNCQSRYASCTTLQYTVVPSVRVAQCISGTKTDQGKLGARDKHGQIIKYTCP